MRRSASRRSSGDVKCQVSSSPERKKPGQTIVTPGRRRGHSAAIASESATTPALLAE
jgi:hypothetical protein